MGADVVNHFEIGKPMDALVISETHPLIAQTSINNLSNTIVFSSDTSMFIGDFNRWKLDHKRWFSHLQANRRTI